VEVPVTSLDTPEVKGFIFALLIDNPLATKLELATKIADALEEGGYLVPHIVIERPEDPAGGIFNPWAPATGWPQGPPTTTNESLTTPEGPNESLKGPESDVEPPEEVVRGPYPPKVVEEPQGPFDTSCGSPLPHESHWVKKTELESGRTISTRCKGTKAERSIFHYNERITKA
jgi:hypothetical protein